MSYSIRQFTANDLDAYKAIRLEALQTEPGNYGNSYAFEAALPQQEWLHRVAASSNARFGLYYNDELIGLTAIIQDSENPEEAYMTQSYIRTAHRGKGLTALLYKARLDWAKGNRIKKLTIGHKKTNLPSGAAIKRHGFTYTHSEKRSWHDGSVEDMVYYELLLV